MMPMDAYRSGDEFVVHFDLPGVSPQSIDIDVRHNVLTVKAQRTAVDGDNVDETVISERPTGTFSRQLFLSDTLDTDPAGASTPWNYATGNAPEPKTASAA
nr:heat shock protein [Kibdelosporangium sp. MJ126-NF4]CTQ99055.1 heat shock protein [Kibdelosporangium sp. MJ126-NF4]